MGDCGRRMVVVVIFGELWGIVEEDGGDCGLENLCG